MPTIERKYASFDNLKFEVDLTDYDKSSSDIEDIFFSVKDDLQTPDDDIFLKTYLEGGIAFDSNQNNDIINVTVYWAYDEYNNFTLNKTYNAGLFIKFKNDPVADEHVDQIFQLIIQSDFLRS